MHQRAFTLIELLAVTTVIASLSATLWAGAAKAKAKRVSWLSNLMGHLDYV